MLSHPPSLSGIDVIGKPRHCEVGTNLVARITETKFCTFLRASLESECSGPILCFYADSCPQSTTPLVKDLPYSTKFEMFSTIYQDQKMLITTSAATAYLSTCQRAPVAGLVDREPPVASCPPQRCDELGDSYFYKLPRLGCLHDELAPCVPTVRGGPEEEEAG